MPQAVALASSHPVELAVLQAMQRALLPEQGPYVCAVSGGQDSVALLLAMQQCAPEGAQVIAIHVDHGLRESSEPDARFVQRVCRKLGVSCVSRRYGVAQYAKRFGLNLEEAARSVRYRLLALEAAKIGTNQIVTAHTGDDQSETVLLHLLRGSGLNGLAGMSTTQELDPESLGPSPPRQ